MKICILFTLSISSVVHLTQANSNSESSNPLQLDPKSQCPIVKCVPDERMNGMDLCFKQEILQPGVIHLKKCGDNKFCHSQLNRCMSDPYNFFQGKLAGQSCEYDFQCDSQICKKETNDYKGKCQGLAENEICQNSQQCEIGLHCEIQTSTCVRQRFIGDKCQSDDECQNNFACANKECVNYGSIRDYEVSDNQLACQSGFNSDINQNGVSICVPTPRIIDKLGPNYQCLSSSDSCIILSFIDEDR